MNRLDRLYKKAMIDFKDHEKREWFERVSSRAVPAYFEMVSYCYGCGIECPDLDTEEGQRAAMEIFEKKDFKEREVVPFDIVMEWWNCEPGDPSMN